MNPGISLIHGKNGHGKSNLIEALYLLSISKSHRVSAERELIHHGSITHDTNTHVTGTIEDSNRSFRIQINLIKETIIPVHELEPVPNIAKLIRVHKQINVNGVPRTASDLVGAITTVMFGAHDLEIVLGSPTIRRRYLDILISQIDRIYLKALKRYQRVLSQRNHLLKNIREGRAQIADLDFWDAELTSSGKQIMYKRADAINKISQLATRIYNDLSDGKEVFTMVYVPSGGIIHHASENELAQSLRKKFEEQQNTDIAQGFTGHGPHRDDLQLTMDGMDAGIYASRGQCRTLAFAMRLAEAQYLKIHRTHDPILLLDDVLSELDSSRRNQILDTIKQYTQCIVTTADVNTINRSHLGQMSRFVVANNQIQSLNSSEQG